jgi:DNA-binding GntR family transcriptional regulator
MWIARGESIVMVSKVDHTSRSQMTEAVPTYSVEIADRLRRDIILGVFPFGARLTLADLEARYDSGQMPIREALRQLQGEGHIELVPNRGARVRPVSIEFVRNLFDVRVAIEAMLTRRAAERIERWQIGELEGAAAEFEQAEPADLQSVLEANRRFHGIINDAAGNQEATDILRRNRQLVTALWHRHGYGERQIAAASAEHRQIVVALKTGDADSAACFAMAHAARAKMDLLAKMAAD